MYGWEKELIQKLMEGAVPLLNSEGPGIDEEDRSYMGPGPFYGLTPEERASKIISALALDEKIALLGGDRKFAIRGFSRLGLPRVWCSDATSGIRGYGTSTCFPSMVALTATWNRALIRETAKTIAWEARAKGISILLGPGINICRIPVCGRNFEYAGEDPCLAGEIAAAYIEGAREGGVIPVIKHFACNNSEYDRHKASSDMDERTLREIYLPAFKRALKKGGGKAVMSSYNPINGVYASENRHLLTEILREEWGFDGFVMSDWISLYSTKGPLQAGLDLEMPSGKWLSKKRVKALLRSKEISEKDIARGAYNILLTLFREGIYDRPLIDKTKKEFCPEHTETALKAAREGIILLKNEGGLLPITDNTVKKIAVLGEQSALTETGGGGSCRVKDMSAKVSCLDGIRAEAGEREIVHLSAFNNRLNDGERNILRTADAVVCCAGFTHWDESECYDREWPLPRNQAALIKECCSLNPKTIIILTGGGDMETAPWISRAPALLHTLYLGQTAGLALGEIIFGKTSPSGKLPFTMANSFTDYPAAENYPKDYSRTSLRRFYIGQGKPKIRKTWPMRYKEGIMTGYRHFTTYKVAPRFPFGFGLTYTTFKIDLSGVSSGVIKPGDTVKLLAKITNTGPTAGAETLQLYIKDEEASLPRPDMELKGFEKVFLEPGETKEVSFEITRDDLSFYHPEKGWTCEPGNFRLLLGTSSMDIIGEAAITLMQGE